MSDNAYMYSSASDEEFAAAADSEEEDVAGGRTDDSMQLGNVVIEPTGAAAMQHDAHGMLLGSPGAQPLKVGLCITGASWHAGCCDAVMSATSVHGVASL